VFVGVYKAFIWAEWHLLSASHGKELCDGVDGSVKRHMTSICSWIKAFWLELQLVTLKKLNYFIGVIQFLGSLLVKDKFSHFFYGGSYTLSKVTCHNKLQPFMRMSISTPQEFLLSAKVSFNSSNLWQKEICVSLSDGLLPFVMYAWVTFPWF
jgi:hypothetical protein